MYATLNISTTSIRLLSVKGRIVKKWGDAPLAPGLVRDGLILQPAAVGEAIDALFKSMNVPRERVITCLSGLSFTYRTLNLPRMKSALLEEAILRGARREIPLPLEELYLSWQPVGSKQEEQDFFVVGVPRNLVDALVQTLSVAGIEPYLMDLKPLALARAAHRENALIVNLEPDYFDIVLVVDGLPAIMHTITPRGEEATLEDNIGRLADELSKTVKFYDDSHPQNPLNPGTPLLLTGELSVETMASQLIQAETEYQVEPLVPPLQFPDDLPAALYASNMGLALKKVSQKTASKEESSRFHDINVNILSGKYRKGKTPRISIRYLLLTVALVMATTLLFPLYQAGSKANTETARLQNELSRVSQELDQTRLAIDTASEVENSVIAITTDTESLQRGHHTILVNRGDYAGILNLVTGALPAEAYFTYLDLNAERISVGGKADNPFTVISYAIALETEGEFSEVRITEIDEFRTVAATGNETPEADINLTTFDILISK